MSYLKRKKGSLESSILGIWNEAAKKQQEKLDPVNKAALAKDFQGRKDKDIDNDGDVDSTDKYLHKRRKAITKNIKKENYEVGTKERRDHTINTTPGQSVEDFEKQVNVMHKKKNSMREALAKMWGIDEKNNMNPFDMKKEKKYNGKDMKKEKKTMTGQPETKVEVEPKIDEKKK